MGAGRSERSSDGATYLSGYPPRSWDTRVVELELRTPKVRQNQRIVNRALVIASGERESGEREGLGFALGASEEEAF